MANSIVSIILIIFIGYVFAFLDRNRKNTENALNKYLYYLALPLTIFVSTYSLDTKFITLNFVLINSIPLLLIFFVVYLLCCIKVLKLDFARTLIITSTLGNLVYLGFVMVSLTAGSSNLGTAAFVSAIQNIVVFTFGIFFLNLLSYENNIKKTIISKTLENPLIISSVLGIFFACFHIQLPDFISNIFKEFSKSTSVVALFIIGMGLYGKKINIINIKKILVISFFKMIILPFIVLCWIYISKDLSVSSYVTFIQYTMPPAAACYVLAYKLNLEADVIAECIVFDTLLYFALFPAYLYLAALIF
ncbi:MAG: AEC family transporter [Elusimicrobiales bacterium]|jgi:predicted permease|nr:AEC family transporter [Elusimicrobiales bacterium]NLH39221.1 hypothetical protein [Elusimicrobiota bacterium]